MSATSTVSPSSDDEGDDSEESEEDYVTTTQSPTTPKSNLLDDAGISICFMHLRLCLAFFFLLVLK